MRFKSISLTFCNADCLPNAALLAGVEIANKGQIRFVRKGPALTGITLTISYEVPSVLVPFANVRSPICIVIVSSWIQVDDW
jgi:hypothetical protein